MHKLVPLIALMLISMAASAQTTKKEIRKACSAEAREQGLKRAEAKTFREDCMQKRLSALPASEKKLTAQQERMKNCSAEAKTGKLKGDERKKFMSECLKSK